MWQLPRVCPLTGKCCKPSQLAYPGTPLSVRRETLNNRVLTSQPLLRREISRLPIDRLAERIPASYCPPDAQPDVTRAVAPPPPSACLEIRTRRTTCQGSTQILLVHRPPDPQPRTVQTPSQTHRPCLHVLRCCLPLCLSAGPIAGGLQEPESMSLLLT